MELLPCPGRLRGFSLFELLVALSVIGVTLGLAVPAFGEMRASQAMRAGREQLLVDLWLARTQALTRQTHTVVCSSADGVDCDRSGHWHRGWLVFVDDNRNRSLDHGEVLLQRGQAMDPGLLAIGPASRSRVRFQQMGYSPGTNLTIRFCDQRGHESASALIVNNVGRPREVSRGLPAGSCD